MGLNRILYVDDEPGLLELGKQYLESIGEFTVDTRTAASDSLPVLSSGQYEAVISDYQMPEMDGIEFLKAVRTAGNPIPFILFTGKGREEVVIQALNEGADFYIQKGGSPQALFTELAHKVRKAIRQRETESSLVMRESYLSAIIENQPGLVWLKDKDSRFLATNEAFAASCGEKSAAGLAGRTDFDIWPREMAEKYRADDKTVIENKRPLHTEEKILDKNQEKWFETFKMPVLDRQGQVIGTTGFARDITERRLAEDTLKDSERKFAAAFEESPDMMAITDIGTGMIRNINHTFISVSGYTREELVGRTTRELNIWVNSDERDEFVQQILAEGEVHKKEVSFRKNGGEARTILLSGKIIGSGDKTYMLTVSEDITERRKAEMAQKESEERLSTILKAAQVGIILVDAASHRILLANPRALEMMQASEGEVIGSVCHRFICPAEKGQCPVTDLGEAVNRSERVLLTRDGLKRPVLKTVVPARIGGQDVLVESFLENEVP